MSHNERRAFLERYHNLSVSCTSDCSCSPLFFPFSNKWRDSWEKWVLISVLAHLIKPKSIIKTSTTILFGGNQFDELGVPYPLSWNPSKNFYDDLNKEWSVRARSISRRTVHRFLIRKESLDGVVRRNWAHSQQIKSQNLSGCLTRSLDVHSITSRAWNIWAELLAQLTFSGARNKVDSIFRQRFGMDYPTLKASDCHSSFTSVFFRKFLQMLPTSSPTLRISSISQRQPYRKWLILEDWERRNRKSWMRYIIGPSK